MKKILFISDGSVLNPILNSQGLPLLNYIAEKGFKSLIYSRENYPREKEDEENLNYLKTLHSNINFFQSAEDRNRKGKWFFNLYNDVKYIKKIVNSEKVNIIHCRSLFPGIIGLYFKLRSLGRMKLVYDNRGLRILEEIETGHWKNQGIKVKILSMIEKRIMQASDSIVVVSEFFKSYLLSHYINLRLENKIKVIPNRTRIHKQSGSINIKNSVPIVCVYSGSAVKWQSLEELERIIKTGITVFNNINFLILTYHVDEFENIFSPKNRLQANILIKKVNQNNVYNELLNGNFGLLIRKNDLINNVSSPLKFAEYLSAGLPVLISEGVGDTEKVVENNRVGIIIRNNDYEQALKEMKNLLEDPEVYLRCRKLAEKEYDIETSFEQYLNIYRNLSEK